MSLDLGSVRLQDLTRQQLRDARSLDFVKWLALFGQTKHRRTASEWFLETFPKSFGAPLVQKELALLNSNDPALIERAASAPATTTNPAFAGALIGLDQLMSGFLEILFSQSLLGRIVGARRVPFNVRAPVQDGGAVYAWVGEGAPKPVGQLSFEAGTVLTRMKAATVIVFTSEFIRGINDATASGLQRVLMNGLTHFTDSQLLSANAATPASPAGILSGVVGVPAGATLQDGLLALLTAFFTQRPGATSPQLIASPAKAAAIAGATNWSSSGVGVPLLVSAAAGDNIILVDGDALVFADDGVEIDVARDASLQMVDNPGTPDATTVYRSMFQDNTVAFRCERFVNWVAAPGAVAFLLPA